MRKPNAAACALSALLMLTGTPALAQQSVDDQAQVWSAIEAQWAANEKGDGKWIESMLSEDFQGWEKTSPAPRNRASLRMWDRLNNELSKSVAHELYPLAIVVHGDVAVAHYLFTRATQKKDGDTAIDNGRYTDVLVRGAEGWKFIAWHGGDDD